MWFSSTQSPSCTTVCYKNMFKFHELNCSICAAELVAPCPKRLLVGSLQIRLSQKHNNTLTFPMTKELPELGLLKGVHLRTISKCCLMHHLICLSK